MRFGPYALLFLAYTSLRVANLYAIEEPLRTFDSGIYVKIARLSLGDLRFWIGERPWTVPLVFMLLPIDIRWIAGFQLTFSVACWTSLAIVVAQTLRAPLLRPVAFAIVLLFSLSSDIVRWDGVVLSESISLSLMALVITAWLLLIDRWRWRTVALLASVAILWTFARDTNAWVLLMAAGLSALAAALGRPARRYLLIAALLTLCFVVSNISVDLSGRWIVPFLNVLGQRILPSPERTAYFAERGMPVTPALMQRSGKLAWDDKWAFLKDRALGSFWVWMRRDGKSSYARFLAAHPASTLVDPLRELDRLLSPDLSRWQPRGYSPVLGGFADLLYFRRGMVMWVLISGALAAAAIATVVRQRDWRLIVPLALLVLAYPHALVVWHGDPNALNRHAVGIGVQLRLAVWMLLLVFADIGLSATGSRRTTSPEQPAVRVSETPGNVPAARRQKQRRRRRGRGSRATMSGVGQWSKWNMIVDRPARCVATTRSA